MDVVLTIYKELFNIQLLHDGFSTPSGSEIFSQVSIAPDDDTKMLFSRYDISYKYLDNTVAFFIHSDLASPPAKDPKKPFVKLDSDFKMRLLVFASPSFFAKTYTVSTGSKAVYYFTNRINNVQSSNRYLSRVIDTYNVANSYDTGAIVNHAGEPYATLQPVNAADNINIADTSFWKKILPAAQTVNNADLQSTSVVKPAQTCYAVIDIFSTGTTNATYNLFNGSGHLLSPVYVLPFKSKT